MKYIGQILFWLKCYYISGALKYHSVVLVTFLVLVLYSLFFVLLVLEILFR